MVDLSKYNVSLNSGASKGSLVKVVRLENDQRVFYKAGRLGSRLFPNQLGIEPLVEHLCYKLAVALHVPCVRQDLCVASMTIYNKPYICFVSKSTDFIKGNEIVYLNDIFASKLVKTREYTEIARATNSWIELARLLVFDYIIMNEDRHDFNLAWFRHGSNLVFTPVFDNGFSLLYDDVKGMLSNYKSASYYCQCNAFYKTFDNALHMVYNSNRNVRDLINIGIRFSTVDKVVSDVYTNYCSLVTSEVCKSNVVVPDIWFDRVADFIKWRLSNVRTFFHNGG